MPPIIGDPAWLLWANRFKEEHKLLLHRIETNAAAIHDLSQLREQAKDLTASSGHLQEENNVLKDRVRQLEEDRSDQDRFNRCLQNQLQGSDQALGQLRTQMTVLGQEFSSLAETIARMDEESKSEREHHVQETLQTKLQIDTLRARGLADNRQAGTGDSKILPTLQ